MPARGDRLSAMNKVAATRLQQRINDAIGERSIQQVADDWDVPYWVIRDTARGATDCPRGLYIPNMAKGLGISTDLFISEAYERLDPVPA